MELAELLKNKKAVVALVGVAAVGGFMWWRSRQSSGAAGTVAAPAPGGDLPLPAPAPAPTGPSTGDFASLLAGFQQGEQSMFQNFLAQQQTFFSQEQAQNAAAWQTMQAALSEALHPTSTVNQQGTQVSTSPSLPAPGDYGSEGGDPILSAGVAEVQIKRPKSLNPV